MSNYEFNYICTIDAYVAALGALKFSPELAADTETYCLPEWEGKGGSALDPHTGRISVLILKGKKTVPYVFDILWLQSLGCDFTGLKDLMLSRKYLLWHNARFDLKFLYSTFGFMPENIRDTLIYSKLLGNATGSKAAQVLGHGYADLCREYLNVHIAGKKEEQTSTWYLDLPSRNLENEWWLKKIEYAANDVNYLFQLEKIMRPALVNSLPDSPLTHSSNQSPRWGLDMQKVLEIELQYVVIAAEIEYRGIGVSRPTLEAYQEGVSQEVKRLGAQLCVDLEIETPIQDWSGELVPTAATLKRLRSSSGLLDAVHKALNLKKIDNTQKATLTRLLDIIDKLYAMDNSEDKDGATVSKDNLDQILIDEEEFNLFSELKLFELGSLKELCPIIHRIVEFKKYVKQEGMNLLKYINPATGRIHYTLTTIGAATNRSSCSSPNLQQVTGRVSVPMEMPLDQAWVGTCKEISL